MKKLWESFNAKVSMLAGGLLALVMVAVCADIIARLVFNSPIMSVPDYVTVAVPIFVFLPMAATEIHDGHIRVEVVFERFGPTGRLLLEILAAAIGLFVIGLMAWKSWGFAVSAWQAGEFLPGLTRVRVWPSKFMIFMGATLLSVQLCANIVRSAKKLLA